MTDKFTITFLSQNRPPRVKPNPAYPDGIEIDTGARPACKADLPYPAECVGAWHVKCNECGVVIAVTAAGRVDDPKSVMAPCKRPLQ